MSFYRKAKFRLKDGAELEIDMPSTIRAVNQNTQLDLPAMSRELSQNSNEQELDNEQYI